MRRTLLASVVVLSVGAVSVPAAAQQGRQAPANKGHEPTAEELEEIHSTYMRSTEPEIAPPTDPLAVSPELRARIGSDYSTGPPSPEGSLEHKQWFPYEERRGDYRVRLLPPFYIEHTRGLKDPSQSLYGVPQSEDTEGLYGLFYYRRRSLKLDMDVAFPLVWRVRDMDNHVVVVGPLAHREAPGETDNWLAPLFFDGTRKDGGYFHSPVLLTTSHWNAAGAFTLVGPYFRDRTGTDVDLGVAPFFFHGDNGSVEGNLRTYTFIPPLLTYHSEHELDGSKLTVVGPVITRTSPERDVFDLAPFYFHIQGKPLTGGVVEEHTTVLPLFHYGRDPDQSLFILPGYYRRVTAKADTLLSPLVSVATTHNGATSMTAIGPGLPIWWNFRDSELGVHAWAVAPFFYTSDSPAGHDWLTPLVGHFETYAQTETTWVAPSFTFNKNTHGWENDLHPILYLGRRDDSSHTVIAPVFWDFADPKSRTTIGFPFFWRFQDTGDGTVTEVAANTVYLEKRVGTGRDWQVHFAPFFSYGEDPHGYFWNFLFGMAGYSHHGAETQTRILWIPFNGTSSQFDRTAKGY